MGQKTHPIGFRLGIKVGERSVKDWDGRWFATGKEYSDLLLEDVRVREHIMTRMADAGVAKVEIERSANMITVTIHAASKATIASSALSSSPAKYAWRAFSTRRSVTSVCVSTAATISPAGSRTGQELQRIHKRSSPGTA